MALANLLVLTPRGWIDGSHTSESAAQLFQAIIQIIRHDVDSFELHHDFSCLGLFSLIQREPDEPKVFLQPALHLDGLLFQPRQVDLCGGIAIFCHPTGLPAFGLGGQDLRPLVIGCAQFGVQALEGFSSGGRLCRFLRQRLLDFLHSRASLILFFGIAAQLAPNLSQSSGIAVELFLQAIGFFLGSLDDLA